MAKAVAKKIDNLSWFSWSPTEDFIVYSTHIKGEKTGDLKRIFGNDDRLPYFRDRSYLHKIDVKTGKPNLLNCSMTSSSSLSWFNDVKLIVLSCT